MRYIRWFAVLALAGTIVLGSGSARAVTLTYNDLTETITLDATGLPTGSNIVPLGGESILVVILNALAVAPTAGSTAVYSLTETAGGSISDLVQFETQSQSTTLQVTFLSAPENVTLIPLVPVYNSAVEVAGGNTIPLPPGLPAFSTAVGSLTITFFSDPEPTAVPEPASIVMMGTGLVSVIGLGLRRSFNKA